MSEYEVVGGMLAEWIDQCTCGSPVNQGFPHERGCGLEPVAPVEQILADLAELDRLRARVAELEAAGSVSPRPPLRGGTPWQILAPEGPSARRDGYAVVTADWSEDADRAEYYVAEQMTREVAEMLVRAGSETTSVVDAALVAPVPADVERESE